MRRPAFPWRCVCGTSKKEPALQGREGLISGGNLPPRGGGKAMRPRRAHHARKAPRRTPPQRERVGAGLPWCVRRRIRGRGEGKEGLARDGKKKFRALGRRRRERARERGEARSMEWSRRRGVGVQRRANGGESLERERKREGGRGEDVCDGFGSWWRRRLLSLPVLFYALLLL